MKVYCEFKHLSTGYINGTIPPQFSKDNVKPIPMCGSDSVMVLDARKNVYNMVEDCIKRMEQLKAVGFTIIAATSFRDKGRVLYSYLKQF